MDIAAYGWDHPEWVGSFYPDDLPVEWRLDFYLNEFRSVVVPVEQWSGLGPGQLDEWAAELTEESRVFLELIGDISPARAREAGALLSGHLAGFVGAQLSDPPQMQLGAPVGIWDGGPETGLAPVPEVGYCWPGPGGIPRCAGSGLACAWLGPGPVSLPHLRQVIEALAGDGREHRSLLVVAGAPPSIQVLREARTLIELLGL